MNDLVKLQDGNIYLAGKIEYHPIKNFLKQKNYTRQINVLKVFYKYVSIYYSYEI